VTFTSPPRPRAAANPNVNGYAIDLDFCKGCYLCVEECPCGAIEMVPEKI
jgi:Pyruvate/2-oxoacid:ferredoxin oxidoreductase delta subunit